jgi:hypothetical protein
LRETEKRRLGRCSSEAEDKELSTEAEESVEALTMERPVKTQQTEKA